MLAQAWLGTGRTMRTTRLAQSSPSPIKTPSCPQQPTPLSDIAHIPNITPPSQCPKTTLKPQPSALQAFSRLQESLPPSISSIHLSHLTCPEQLCKAGVVVSGSGSGSGAGGGRGQGGWTGFLSPRGWGGGLASGLHTLRHSEVRPKDRFQVPMGQMVYREGGRARAKARLWGGNKGCGCRKRRHSWSRRDCGEREPGREERFFWHQRGRWSHRGEGRRGAGL